MLSPGFHFIEHTEIFKFSILQMAENEGRTALSLYVCVLTDIRTYII